MQKFKVVLIAGGSRGHGTATAEAFADHGAVISFQIQRKAG
ncbi:hypothetical protein P4H83_32375 [Paenibacillus favisporus]|nr:MULTISPECIES: hypothetical protein [Paenibacillus]MEC0179577.1 hypothetical protein [Paenibacillus favisporus]